MKMITTLALLLSTAAYACPDLTGAFLCESNYRQVETTIETHEDGYQITEGGSKGFFSNDGTIRRLPDTEIMRDGEVSGNCKDDKYYVNFTAKALDEGEVIAKQVSQTEYVIKGDRLYVTRKTKMKGIPMPTQKMICTRL